MAGKTTTNSPRTNETTSKKKGTVIPRRSYFELCSRVGKVEVKYDHWMNKGNDQWRATISLGDSMLEGKCCKNKESARNSAASMYRVHHPATYRLRLNQWLLEHGQKYPLMQVVKVDKVEPEVRVNPDYVKGVVDVKDNKRENWEKYRFFATTTVSGAPKTTCWANTYAEAANAFKSKMAQKGYLAYGALPGKKPMSAYGKDSKSACENLARTMVEYIENPSGKSKKKSKDTSETKNVDSTNA
jgi:hypothetical protein